MKSGTCAAPALRSVKILDQLRVRIRYLHYSLRTEEAYVHWVRAFIRFHGIRHPATMGAVEVEQFLAWLACERQVSTSTRRQALSALLFLYGKVLGQDLPWMQKIGRPHVSRRLPVVLYVDEVARVLPDSLLPGLRQQLARSRLLWAADQAGGCGGVFMPDALDRKYPRAGASWTWFWLFPQSEHATDPRSGLVRSPLDRLAGLAQAQNTSALRSALSALTQRAINAGRCATSQPQV